MSHAARIRAVLGGVFRNPELRRVELAFAGFNAAEWGVWIAMLVYAYEQGGATTAGLVAAAQLVPAGLAAPFAAVLADRYPPARVLALGYVAQGLAMGATAAALLAHGPPLLAYALAAVGATCVTVTRPTQSALVPALARTPDELTATNVVSGWIEAVSVLAAPAGAGVLLAVASPGWVFAVLAVVALLAALVVAPVQGPPPAAEPRPPLEEALAGFRLLGREPAARTLVGILSAQFVAIGALDVLYVVLAISVLDLGGSGAGYLNAAFGAGGVAGIAVTVALIGRRRLMPALVLGVVVWGAAFALLGAWPTTLGALLLLGRCRRGPQPARRRRADDPAANRSGRRALTRLRRAGGPLDGRARARLAADACAGEPLRSEMGDRRDRRAAPAGRAAGKQAAPGDRPPRARAGGRDRAPALAAPVLAAGSARAGRRSRAGSSSCRPRPGQPSSARASPATASTSSPTASSRSRRGGRELRTIGRGEGFGEIALLENVPRTATVTARTDSRLYALDKPSFLASVSSHPRAAGEAERLVRERLPSQQATIAP